jgi:hypothetical protein
VRVLAFALALVAATGVARADDEQDDEQDDDGEFAPMPKRSVALSFVGHGTRVGGYSETGFGPALELALGSGRWQYFIEGAIAGSTVQRTVDGVHGRMAQAGGGARWLARQFRPSSRGGIELFLLSRLGVQRFYLDDGTRVGRPELAIGFGIQARVYKRPRLAFRLDARILLTPSDRMETASTGFSTGVGLAW